MVKNINRNLPETGKEEVSKVFRPRLETPDIKDKIKFIKMKATTYGKLPEWHLGYPFDGTSWIFIDEINVN